MRDFEIVIETERLRLRNLREADLGELVALIGDWEVARWLSRVPHPYSEAEGRDWIAAVREDHATGRPRRFGIALKPGDRLIGGIGLDADAGDGSNEAGLGYWLGRRYWRHGYGREAVAAIVRFAFRTLGLPTVRAWTDPANAASQKVLLSCGFSEVGSIELATPTRNGGGRDAPLFCVSPPPHGL